MANITQINVNGTTYDLKDNISGYTTAYDGTTTSDTKYDALFLETLASGIDAVMVGGVDMDLLWTNSAPTSAFSAQTIQLDLSGYAEIIIVATSRTDLDVRFTSVFPVGNYLARLASTLTGTNTDITRNVTISSTSLAFETGYNGSTANTSYCIPVYVYGIRKATGISGRMGMELLWTNPSPTSSFASQTVSVDLSDYAGVLIVCKQHKSVESYFNFLSLTVAESIRFLCGSGKLSFRNATVSSAGVVFTDGSYVNTYGTDAVNNDYVIPYKIYGIR